MNRNALSDSVSGRKLHNTESESWHMSVCVSSALSIATSLAAVTAGIPGGTDLSSSGVGGGMSLSHMSVVSQSMMQPLSHALASSMLNMPGIDHQPHNSSTMSQQQPQLHNHQHHPPLHASPLTNGSTGSGDVTDHPNPDMLLALIARNKALEGKCDLWWLPNLSSDNGQ